MMVFAALVGVLQLAVIAGLVRSVRITTLIQAVIIGAVVCGPVTVAVQWVVTRAVAARSSLWMTVIVEEAGKSYDPVVEEVLKLLPLLLLAIILPRVHRQLGWTDHFLIGTALGSGFALAEALMRHAETPEGLYAATGGWSIGGMSNIMHTPWSALTTWQPQPLELGSGVYSLSHALWTGVAAIGLAWFFRQRIWWKPLGLLPVALASISHMYFNGLDNTPFTRTWVAHLANSVFLTLHDHLIWLVFALIVVDRVAIARASGRSPGLLLPGEPRFVTNPWPLLKAAAIGAPWSVLPAWNVALQRRAAWYGLGARLPVASASAAATAVAQLGRVRRSDWQATARQHGLLATLRRTDWRALLIGQILPNWRMFLWVFSVIPGLVFLVVGGWPKTREVQRIMLGPLGTVALVAGVLAGVAFMVSRVPGLVKGIRRIPRPAWHELRLRPLGKLAIATTSVLAAVVLIARLFTTGESDAAVVVNGVHVLNALSSLMIAVGLALMILGFLWFPPSLLMLEGLGILVPVLSNALLVTEAVGLTTALTGAMLNEAAGPEPGGGEEKPAQESPGKEPAEEPPAEQGEPDPTDSRFPERRINWDIDRVREKVPEEWGPGETNKKWDPTGGDPRRNKPGIRWEDPNDPGNGVRVDKGDPNSSNPSQRVDHVVVRSGGRILGPDGEPINGPLNQNPQAHIPVEDYVRWITWNAPK